MAKKKRSWKVEVYEGHMGWWWRIVAGNNKVLAHSETYTRKQNCLKTARPVAKRLGCPLVIRDS